MVDWLRGNASPGNASEVIPEPDWEKDESFAISDFLLRSHPMSFDFYQADVGSLTPLQRSH